MQERELHYLLDMLISARLALTYISGKTWKEFKADTQLQDSVVRRLEIIGEASRRISESSKMELPKIPWHEIIGMRNRIVHEYDRLKLDIVWKVVQRELPPLIVEIEKIVPPDEDE